MVSEIDVDSIVDRLGAWSTGAGPLYIQLADALQRSMDRGDVPKGGRLPSERQLSSALGLSRTTVVAAYDRLRAAGRLQSHRGSGTRVSGQAVWQPAAHLPEDFKAAPLIEDGPFAFSPPAEDLELTVGALPGAALIAGEAERVAREDLPELLRSFGYLPFGHPPLRAAVARHMGELGIPTRPEQVLITSGAQQAIDLLARHLGGPDTSVIMENPTYPPAIDSFRATGAHLVPIPLDEGGLRTDVMRVHAQQRTGQIAYLNPICQNPTGSMLADVRRREVMRIASESDLLVIDDLTSAYLTYSAWPPATIGSLDREERVITVGSLSKVAWGGLRIGWIRGPSSLIPQLAARKIDLDFSTGLFNQALAVRLFDRMDELIPRVHQQSLERLDALETALATALPSWRWAHPAGGLCLWIRLPTPDATAYARLAAEYGVIVRPGPLFSADGGNRDCLRLTFGHDPDVLQEAVARLAKAWAAFRPALPRPGRGVAITV